MRIQTIKCDRCKSVIEETDVNSLHMEGTKRAARTYELCNKCADDIQKVVQSSDSFTRYRLKKAVQIIKNWEEKVGNDKAVEVTGCAVGHVTDILDAIAEEV